MRSFQVRSGKTGDAAADIRALARTKESFLTAAHNPTVNINENTMAAASAEPSV
jgi:hypothetical protein